jgi:hypothetical protein
VELDWRVDVEWCVWSSRSALRAREQRVQAEHAVQGIEQVHECLCAHGAVAVVVDVQQAAHGGGRRLVGVSLQLLAHGEECAETGEHAHADAIHVDDHSPRCRARTGRRTRAAAW